MSIVKQAIDLGNREVQAALARARELLLGIVPEGSFASQEQAMLALTGELGRLMAERRLQDLADSFGDRVMVEGAEYKRHHRSEGHYHSLCGPLTVERYTFRLVGVHNGPTEVPLDLAAGLVQRATPAFARNLAHGYATYDLRTHREQLELAARVPPARATMERIATAIATRAHREAPELEIELRRAEKLPGTAHAVVLGLDRTSVPMAEPRAADSDKPPPQRSRPYQRKKPDPIDVNFRMAYVGTVTFVDRAGEAVGVRRYAAPACDDPKALVASMTADLTHALCQRPMRVAVMQDGAPELWNLVRDGLGRLRGLGLLRRWEEGIDLYHLLERLGEAFDCLGRDDKAMTLERWRDDLLSDDGAIDSILAYLSFYRHDLKKKARTALDEHLTYIENNKDRMKYAKLLRRGLPLGSGVTESAAKNVIGLRAKRSGQRWSQPGLRGVLTLRALLKSERLHPFWTRLSRRHIANVVNLRAAA